MGAYQSYHATVRGYSHILKGTVGQDWSVAREIDGGHVAVISDGHGDPACFRSHIGSKRACEIAADLLEELAVRLKAERQEDQMLGRTGEKIAAHLYRRILSAWSGDLNARAAENPPTDQELAGVRPEYADIYRSGSGLLHMYGATLIAMLKTDKYLLLLQQGDGRCTVVHADGTMDQPIPWDPRCQGRFTTSLCDPDAADSGRVRVIDLAADPIIACYACSDGVEDSYETMDDTLKYLGMLTGDYVEEGRDHFLETLPPHLSGISEHGSGDDVSVACIIDPAAAAAYSRQYRLEYDYMVQSARRREAEERLASMARKAGILREELQRKRQAAERARTSARDSESRLQQVLSLLSSAKEKTDSDARDSESAEAALTAAQEEYDEYMALRQTFVDRQADAGEKMAAIRQLLDALKSEAPAPESAEEESPVYARADEPFPEFDGGESGPSSSGTEEEPADPAPGEAPGGQPCGEAPSGRGE